MSDDIAIKNLKAALALADAGFSVFPARAIYNSSTRRWNKPPFIQNWQSHATTDLRKIKGWWHLCPDAIPAIRCDDFVVIDADRHAGGPDGVAALAELTKQHGDWPNHPIVHTPSSGEHHFFCQPNPAIGNRTGQLPPGIDVRGTGGFVIGPGAVLPNGAEWRLASDYSTDLPHLPPWLEQMIRADKEVPAQRTAIATRATIATRASTASREERYAETVLEGCISEVENAPKGRRNTVLNNVAYRLGRVIARGWIDRNKVEINLLYAAVQLENEDGLTAVLATIKSGIDAGCRKPHPDLSDRKGGRK